jgi:isoprenylcysteine carboxyl methyltransferase (ICMT) family protein YpbQ
MDTLISKYLYINYVLNINFTLILVLPTCSQWFTVLLVGNFVITLIGTGISKEMVG